MVSMDIFRQDPFSTFQLTTAIERIPYQPTLLGDMGIFTPTPIRTKALGVEERDGQLVLIQSSQRGQPVNSERTTEKRKMRYFEVPRITQGDTISADEIEGIRQFGTESELMQVMAEVARRLSGPTGLVANVNYTWENMRLAAIQGLLTDADGSVIYNWYDEFGFAAPAAVHFDLAAGVAGSLRPKINEIVRAMYRAAKGAFKPNQRIGALCGDAFYDAFTNHPDVIRTFINWQDAALLRGSQGGAFTNFNFADVEWINYRGSDDNSTIKIPDNAVKFFPIDAPSIFEVAFSPLESFDFVNTPGRDMYVLPIFDRDRNMWWRQEVYSYPLFICKRPEVLQSGLSDA
jgi:hypothetical protein